MNRPAYNDFPDVLNPREPERARARARAHYEYSLALTYLPSRVRNPQLGVPVRLWLVGTRISRAIGEPSDGRNPCMPPISATADEVI